MAKTKTTKAQNAGCGPGMDEEWKAESDLRTLIDAEKIKLDAPRLKAAMAKKREMEKSLGNIGK